MSSTNNMHWCLMVVTLWTLLLPIYSVAKTTHLLVHTSTGVHAFKVTTAASHNERLIGLQGWTSLAADEGMLFVFPEATQRPFWMKHIDIPLDILFIDSGGRVVDIIRHAEPGSETPLVASNPFQSALEVNADTATRLGIGKGDHVDHPLIEATANTLPE